MRRSLLLYLVIISTFVSLIWLVIDAGKDFRPEAAQRPAIETTTGSGDNPKPVMISSDQSVWEQFANNIQHPLSLLLLQLIVIVAVSRLFGKLLALIGQPSVIGEIIAGIILGPSLLGLLLPDVSGFLFPKESLATLQFLSQIGLAFFMFIVGMELDVAKLRNKAHAAVVISHASIVFPFFLGVGLSYFIYEQFAPAGTTFVAFSLFMGIAMSITAFPVLARILQERGLTKTALGAMAITCAAADDVTAWCILAAVVAVAKAGSITSALFTIMLAVLFVLIMLQVVRPWLNKLGKTVTVSGRLSRPVVALSFLVLLLSAYFAEIIGIHALFGAFLAGVIMPQNMRFKDLLTGRLEDISVLLLLPVFFAFTGLRTQIGLLTTGQLWASCGVVFVVAVLGKFGGSALSAKAVGNSWKDALSIGALMNTRGLMELVVLNIGYDLGVLSPEIFAIMVLMALGTTFMTGPLLDLINYAFKRKQERSPATKELSVE